MENKLISTESKRIKIPKIEIPGILGNISEVINFLLKDRNNFYAKSQTLFENSSQR